jgi:hypothetical protein
MRAPLRVHFRANCAPDLVFLETSVLFGRANASGVDSNRKICVKIIEKEMARYILLFILALWAAGSYADESEDIRPELQDSVLIPSEELARCFAHINGGSATLAEAVNMLRNTLERAGTIEQGKLPNRRYSSEDDVADDLLDMMTNGEYGQRVEMIGGWVRVEESRDKAETPKKRQRDESDDEDYCEIYEKKKRRVISPSTRDNILAMIERKTSLKTINRDSARMVIWVALCTYFFDLL